MRIRCVTINLKGLEFGWFEARSAALIKGLSVFDADLICFQDTFASDHFGVLADIEWPDL